jgi:hypothetical protein
VLGSARFSSVFSSSINRDRGSETQLEVGLNRQDFKMATVFTLFCYCDTMAAISTARLAMTHLESLRAAAA